MEVTAAPHVARPPVIDLMQALKNSLAAKPGPVAERKTLIHAVPKATQTETQAKKSKRKAG